MATRFWVFVNDGFVRIALRPGQTLSHCSYQTTDEGWSSEAETWEHTGTHIRRELYRDGVDCDGRLSSEQADECHVNDLAGLEVMGEPTWPRLPVWKERTYSQRDYSAEAMNY